MVPRPFFVLKKKIAIFLAYFRRIAYSQKVEQEPPPCSREILSERGVADKIIINAGAPWSPTLGGLSPVRPFYPAAPAGELLATLEDYSNGAENTRKKENNFHASPGLFYF